jgi:hypothetical protein
MRSTDKRRPEGDGPTGFITVASPLRGELLRAITKDRDEERDEDEDEDENAGEASGNKSGIGPERGETRGEPGGEAKGDPRGEAKGDPGGKGSRSQMLAGREYSTWGSRRQASVEGPDITEVGGETGDVRGNCGRGRERAQGVRQVPTKDGRNRPNERGTSGCGCARSSESPELPRLPTLLGRRLSLEEVPVASRVDRAVGQKQRVREAKRGRRGGPS